MIKIGITERGDASFDYSWINKLVNPTTGSYLDEKNVINGAILITKNITDDFITKVIELHENSHELVVHATCTGFGGTDLEPNVPYYKTQLTQLYRLIYNGFPIEKCVLRIDPIIPTTKGLVKVDEVLDFTETLFASEFEKLRIRISILDEYTHVKQRLMGKGWPTVYGDDFQPSPEKLLEVIKTLSKHELTFETCAEYNLTEANKMLSDENQASFLQIGCVSILDIERLGLYAQFREEGSSINPQKRNGCLCLDCKTELLNNKSQCHHGCLYCYWR